MQSKPAQWASVIIAGVFCIVMPVMGYIKVGLPPVIIIGTSAILGFIFWYITYLKHPTEPRVILPLFLLTVAGLQFHIIEEYLTFFGPAMSRLFGIPWTHNSFTLVFSVIGPPIYTLTALGLYYRVPIAGFIAWFMFIGPGVAEFTHFIFPALQPHIEPNNPGLVTTVIRGTEIVDMPNYWFKTTGKYYFAGMWTAVLPMVPGSYAIYRLLRDHLKESKAKPSNG